MVAMVGKSDNNVANKTQVQYSCLLNWNFVSRKNNSSINGGQL